MFLVNEVLKMMTLEEAIDHCEEVAKIECGKCAEEHLQLAKWLKELKERRSFDTDLISRKQAINALSTITMYKGSIPFGTAVMRIEQLPSAQPKRGVWNYNSKIGTFKVWTCDQCGWNYEAEFNFCPNCGAKMEKV